MTSFYGGADASDRPRRRHCCADRGFASTVLLAAMGSVVAHGFLFRPPRHTSAVPAKRGRESGSHICADTAVKGFNQRSTRTVGYA
jgi:hypothetical protein